MISGKKELTPRSVYNFIYNKSTLFLRNTLKYTISLKHPKIHCKYNNKTQKFLLLLFPGTFTQKEQKSGKKKNLQLQNIVCFEKQICFSQENFTQKLFVVFVRLRSSAVPST